jgi:hypothetical protein
MVSFLLCFAAMDKTANHLNENGDKNIHPRKTLWEFFAFTGKIATLAAGVLIGLSQPLCAQVTIQIVNDSGVPDGNVFVKVAGYNIGTNPTMTPANLFANLSNAVPANATSISLTNLPTSGSIVSSISGNTDTIYSCQVDYVNSGTMYFTYNKPFTFDNGLTPSPPPNSSGNAYRYDYAEFTIDNTNAANNAIDVTYVDKFGIPLQLEWFDGASSNLRSGSYVYASTKTLVNLLSTYGFGQAAFTLTNSNITPGWQYNGPDSYTNFARILAPQKVSGTNASVSPYPNVSAYLDSLTIHSHQFWLNGYAPQGGYYYLGYKGSLSANPGGWMVTLAPTANIPPYNNTLITGTQYTKTITFEIGNSNASQYVYGAPVGPNLYSVNGILVTNDTSPSYKVETWMIGDVLSSLNYGFWGGIYGTNSADWYSEVKWTAFPFGSARAVNDDHYNPYAALIYDYSDPYSFAFSERITPDVLMAPTNGDTVRITILPDDRLDSPVVSVAGVTQDTITLNWNAISGATGYQVNVIRPTGMAAVLAPANATSCTLTNLEPGTPYVMSVQATGTANGNPIITPARNISATTTGTNAAENGGTIPVQITFNAADPFYQLGNVYINGYEMYQTNGWHNTNGQNIAWNATVGTNQVVVTVLDNSNNVVYNDWLQFVLAQPFMFTNVGYYTNVATEYTTNAGVITTNSIMVTNEIVFTTTNSAISGIVLGNQKLSEPAPTVGGKPNGVVGTVPGSGTSVVTVTNYTGSATNFAISLPTSSAIVGLTYVPAETRKFAPLETSQPSGVQFIELTMLKNGEFQFEYTNGTAQSFNVYASTNLLGWTEIGTAVNISPGLYQFTDSKATNYPHRFYQLRSP